MLQTIQLNQFGGLNTVVDSQNAGVSSARTARNVLLRPIGALSVPPAWSSFSPGGVALDFGFLTNIDFLFNTGVRLLLQSSALDWWDVTPKADGQPVNTIVSYSGATLAANQTIAATEVMAFKLSSTVYMQIGALDFAYTIQRVASAPYYTTAYSSDRAFTTGFGPVFADAAGNSWLWRVDPVTGLEVVPL